MSRLPTPGSDAGAWGDILNEYLSQAHKADGTLKDGSVGSTQIQANAVTNNIIAPGAVNSASIAAGAVTSSALAINAVNSAILANGAVTSNSFNISAGTAGQVLTLDSAAPGGFTWSTPTVTSVPVTSVAGKIGDVTLAKADVGLTNVDNTSDADKPVSTATQTALDDKANTTHTHAESDITNLTTDLAATEKTANKGVASGYAALDSSGKVPAAQLPSSVLGTLQYQGAYDASGGSFPTGASKGYYWVISVPGVINSVSYDVGDWLTYNGASWDKLDNQQTVTSVAGRTGDITIAESDVTNLTTDLGNKVDKVAGSRLITTDESTLLGNTSGTNTGDNATNSQYSGLAASKQDTLVSGTNIKTINSTSLLGSGDIAISTTDATKLPLAGGTMSGTINTQDLLPATTATYSLGDSSHYYSNAYTTRQYFNSTAYLDGGTAGAVGITGNVGIGTTTPAHYLDVSKTVNSRTAYGINSTMTASTLQSDVASTGNDETFTNSHYAWKFVASAAHTVGSISVRLKKVGTVTNTTDTIQLKIFSDNAGTPDALLLTTDSMRMGTLTTSYVEYLFGGELTLVNGTTYWIAVRKSAAVTGGGSIAIDRNGTALTTCNTATPVSGDWTVNAGLGRYTVYGRSPIGIRGISTNYFGVYGISTNNIGVYGSSTNWVGVYGSSTNSYGVQGISTNWVGVYGNSTNNVGVYGTSTNSFGVNGNSTNSYGAVLTQSGTLTAANSSNAVLVRRNGVTNSTGSLNYSGNVLQITDAPTGTGTVSGALISGLLSVASDGSGTTERIRFDPRVANGASAVAHMLDTGNALSTAGALLLDVRNNGVSKHAVDLNGNIIEKVPTTPASATAAGVQGTICWDANYVYVCVATNTWKRSTLGSW
jgi:hypothetical protein